MGVVVEAGDGIAQVDGLLVFSLRNWSSFEWRDGHAFNLEKARVGVTIVENIPGLAKECRSDQQVGLPQYR